MLTLIYVWTAAIHDMALSPVPRSPPMSARTGVAKPCGPCQPGQSRCVHVGSVCLVFAALGVLCVSR